MRAGTVAESFTMYLLTYRLPEVDSEPGLSSSSLEDRMDRLRDRARPLSTCILSTYCVPGTQLDTTVV